MTKVYERVEQKVRAIFRELAGERAERIFDAIPPATGDIAHAVATDIHEDIARDIALHLSDWTTDAAFLMAVHMFPERFTREEIEAGVGLFLIHAPNHVAAAAKLYGHPVSDVFGVGDLVDDT